MAAGSDWPSTFRAVQLHGGTIEIESEAGRGATFRLTLPLTGWTGPHETRHSSADHWAEPGVERMLVRKKATATPPPAPQAKPAPPLQRRSRRRRSRSRSPCPRRLKSKNLPQITLPAPQKTPPPRPPAKKRPHQLQHRPSAGGAAAGAAIAATAATRRDPLRRRAPPVRSRLRTESLACALGAAASAGKSLTQRRRKRWNGSRYSSSRRRNRRERPGDGAATGAEGRCAGAGPAEGFPSKRQARRFPSEATSPGGLAPA